MHPLDFYGLSGYNIGSVLFNGNFVFVKGNLLHMSISNANDIKVKIDKLRRELEHHSKLYYVYDAPEISDYEYDRMFYELVTLEREYPELDDPASPHTA